MNTAIFSVVNACLLRPLPFPDSQSVVTVDHVPAARRFFPACSALGLGRQLSRLAQAERCVRIDSGVGRPRSAHHRRRPPATVVVTASDADLFKVLREAPKPPLLTQEECQPGRDTVIVVSNVYARSHFGSPAAAVGTADPNRPHNYQVIGVMPPEVNVKAFVSGID